MIGLRQIKRFLGGEARYRLIEVARCGGMGRTFLLELVRYFHVFGVNGQTCPYSELSDSEGIAHVNFLLRFLARVFWKIAR